MASPVVAQLILCDAAQADASGKVSMLGAGWSITGTPTAPQAVAVLIKVPWDRTNQKIDLALRLLGADGQPVHLTDPSGGAAQAIGTEAQVEAGRPPGIAPGSHINAAFALSVGPMPLEPGRYEWRLDVDGKTSAVEEFTVMPSA